MGIAYNFLRPLLVLPPPLSDIYEYKYLCYCPEVGDFLMALCDGAPQKKGET